MYRTQNARTPDRRRGIILLVVLVMLTLFAVVGLTFVFYADSEAASMKQAREAATIRLPEVDAETAFALFLNQLIYDGADDAAILSALRGHSLLRNMFGYNDGGTNTVRFNGIGRIHGDPINNAGDFITFSWIDSAGTLQKKTLDSYDLINYQCFLDANGNFVDTYTPPKGVPTPSFADSMNMPGNIRDPERLGVRDNTNNGIANNISNLAERGLFIGGFNAGYTYPDYNSLFLAAVKADGTVLVPSFYRPWGAFAKDPTTGAILAPNQILDPTKNGNWYANSYAKHMILRPRPVDNITQAQINAYNATVPAAQQLPYPLMPETLEPKVQLPSLQTLIAQLQNKNQLFPYPDDINGDVQNLLGVPATGVVPKNDSLWMDPGAPVITMADGRKFKMMYAPLIMDLDGKFNVNAGGNIRGFDFKNPNLKSPNISLSNMGFGAWEMNPKYVVTRTDANGNYEFVNLFFGKATAGTTTKWGKYGPDQLPALGGNAPGGSGIPNFYASVDYDSTNDGQGGAVTGAWSLPTVGTVAAFPTYPAGYSNNKAGSTEAAAHPLLFDNFRAAAYDPNNNDMIFQASNMAALLRYGDTGSEFLGSDLLTLCPLSFSDKRTRGLVTTHSFDPNRPTATPWIYDRRNAANIYQLAAGQYPTGQPVPFPPTTSRYDPVTFNSVPSPKGSDFADNDWRSSTSNMASLPPANFNPFDSTKRYDLNQSLPDYPVPGNDGRITDIAGFTKAQNARIDMASQIYYRLVRVTGAFDPFTYDPAAKPAITPAAAEMDALRWLAQLAVNMVDYIDKDDYITPFNWGSCGNAAFITANSGQWVYGTELPRVLLNEAYAEYVNNGNDPGLGGNIAKGDQKATLFDVNVFLELHNPFDADDNLVDPIVKAQGAVSYKSIGRLQMPQSAAGAPAYPVYMVSLTKANAGLFANNNLFGNPDGSNINAVTYPPFAIGNAPNGNILTYKDGMNNDQLCVVSDFTPPDANVDTTYILPGNRKYAAPNNQRGSIGKDATGVVVGADTFYMLGAAQTLPVDPAVKDPKLVSPSSTLVRPQMTYRYNVANNRRPSDDPPTIMLHRLLCPNLAPQPDPTDPKKLGYYNPYITVDYMESVTVNDAANVDVFAQNDGANKAQPITPVATRASVGKRQPYGAHNDIDNRRTQAPWLRIPNPNTNPPITNNNHSLPNQPQHTFFQHNADVNVAGPNSAVSGDWSPNNPPPTPATYPQANRPFDWLVHLDRPLTSPLELLQVSGFKPHQLTQQYMLYDAVNGVPVRFQHRVNWFDETARLYRIFDFLQTRPLATNTNQDERVAGRMNINTIWDIEVFRALCDAQTSNYFLAADVDNVFNVLVGGRDKNGNPYGRSPDSTSATPSLGKDDRPFLSLANTGSDAGSTQYPAGIGIKNTFFRGADNSNATAALRLFQRISGATNDMKGNLAITDADPNGANAHPYLKYQLMTKIFNNVTVRSNVFAIWVTVGFFEVTDDTTRPVKLGAEIGRSENKHVRHRMFAIVDRSWFTSNPGPQTRFNPHAPPAAGLPAAGNPQPILYFSIID